MDSPESDKGGRPAIGPKVPINFPSDLLNQADTLATEAGISRAAWIRGVVAAATVEPYERRIAPGEWRMFLTWFGLTSHDAEVCKTAKFLYEAAEAGAIEQGRISIQSREERDLYGGFCRASLVTRELQVRGEPITVYQIVKMIANETAQRANGWVVENPASALELFEDAAEIVSPPLGPPVPSWETS